MKRGGDVRMEAHRRNAEVEDIEFLMDAGISMRDACARVGVSVDKFEKLKARGR